MAIFYNPNKKKGLFYAPSGATGGAGGGGVLSIEYSAARFCEDGTDPVPGITGATGGTFSSTSGLVFISTSTGQVDLSASTAGTYVVTYTAPSSNTATTSISIDSIPVVSAGADVAICTGNNTILTATGATTYSWSTGETTASITVEPTTNTTYTVTGFNGVCQATDSVDVTVNPLPTVSILGTLSYCAGGSTTLDAGSFVSYLWSNGETTQTISATAGNYTVTVTDSNGCSNTSAQVTVSELPLDSATVTYSAAAYCQMPTGALAVDGYYPLYTTESASNAASSDGTSHSHTLSGTTYYMPNAGVIIYHGNYSLTTPAPTITGETGTFSESTGNLSIDSSTGVINVNSSTAGTYTVVYTTNGTCPNTVNNTITINALDSAAFSYSDSDFIQSMPDPTPTITGVTGGTFSGTTGLVINSTTGEIDLDASTIATHTIIYTTAGTCPNTSTQTVNVLAALLQLDNAYSMSFDGINDNINVGNVASLQGATDFTISSWIKLNSLGVNRIFGAYNTTTNKRIVTLGVHSDNTLISAVSNNGQQVEARFSTSTIPINTWKHVAVTFSSGAVNFYIDGVKETPSATTITQLYNVSTDYFIGALQPVPSSVYMDGEIDEVSVFNTALTELEIKSIYYATETGKTADLNDLTTPPAAWYRIRD